MEPLEETKTSQLIRAWDKKKPLCPDCKSIMAFMNQRVFLKDYTEQVPYYECLCGRSVKAELYEKWIEANR